MNVLRFLSAALAVSLCAARPTIEILPQSTFATGADERGAPGGLPFTHGDVRVPFKLTLPAGKHLQFVWQQKNIDETLGRVTTPSGAYTYPGAYHDVAEDVGAGYKTGDVTWNAGYFERHRVCCPFDKVRERLAYVGGEDDFGPSSGGKSLFVFKFRLLRSLEHPDLFYRTSLQARVPLRKHAFVLAQAGIDSDYFDRQPIPLYYNYVNVGIEKDFSPNVSYKMLVENLTQRNQGYPFAAPNAIHRAKIVLQADFKEPF